MIVGMVEHLPLLEYAATTTTTIFVIKKGGLSALAYLHDINYDIDAIILDLSLPDMSGFSLTKEIRSGEQVRGKQRPLQIFWVTDHPFDRGNSEDAVLTSMERYDVIATIGPGEDPQDPVGLIKLVEAHLNSVDLHSSVL